MIEEANYCHCEGHYMLKPGLKATVWVISNVALGELSCIVSVLLLFSVLTFVDQEHQQTGRALHCCVQRWQKGDFLNAYNKPITF